MVRKDKPLKFYAAEIFKVDRMDGLCWSIHAASVSPHASAGNRPSGPASAFF
jgi:hypothetical protein